VVVVTVSSYVLQANVLLVVIVFKIVISSASHLTYAHDDHDVKAHIQKLQPTWPAVLQQDFHEGSLNQMNIEGRLQKST
jgi:hypothetical protein